MGARGVRRVMYGPSVTLPLYTINPIQGVSSMGDRYIYMYVYIYVYICTYTYPPQMTPLDPLELIILIILGALWVYQAN